MLFQSHTIDKRLGDGLNGKWELGITDLVHGSIGGHEADSKPVGICLGQLGHIGGNSPFGFSGKLGVQIGQVILDGRCFEIGFQ